MEPRVPSSDRSSRLALPLETQEAPPRSAAPARILRPGLAPDGLARAHWCTCGGWGAERPRGLGAGICQVTPGWWDVVEAWGHPGSLMSWL